MDHGTRFGVCDLIRATRRNIIPGRQVCPRKGGGEGREGNKEKEAAREDHDGGAGSATTTLLKGLNIGRLPLFLKRESLVRSVLHTRTLLTS